MAPSEILGVVYAALMGASSLMWIGFNIKKYWHTPHTIRGRSLTSVYSDVERKRNENPPPKRGQKAGDSDFLTESGLGHKKRGCPNIAWNNSWSYLPYAESRCPDSTNIDSSIAYLFTPKLLHSLDIQILNNYKFIRFGYLVYKFMEKISSRIGYLDMKPCQSSFSSFIVVWAFWDKQDNIVKLVFA